MKSSSAFSKLRHATPALLRAATSSGRHGSQRLLEGGRNIHPRAGDWNYLYRAVDSTGATIDFWLSAERDAAAAKRFFQRALQAPGHPRPRVITVDGNPSYPKVIAELKNERRLGRRCRCRTCPYLNNIVEQDYRAIKRRVNASQGFRSFDSAWRTIQGYEVQHMIRKGQVRWLPKGDVVGQLRFVNETFGMHSA